MHPAIHRSRSSLVIGAALLGCALTSARKAEAQNMVYTTLTAFTLNGSGTYAATPGLVTLPSTSWSGSTTYAYQLAYTYTPITSGSVTTYCNAYNSGYDFLGAYLSTAFLTDWTLSGSFVVTISQSVTVQIFNGDNWLINGSALIDGQTIAAGSYVITWSYVGTHSYLITGLGFSAAAPAIPLPGAAGLAAMGLLGTARRRRR